MAKSPASPTGFRKRTVPAPICSVETETKKAKAALSTGFLKICSTLLSKIQTDSWPRINT